MQYIRNIGQDRFTSPPKARYFFSQIIDAYDELETLAKTPSPEQNQFKRSLNIFRAKQRKNLDFWIERSLQKNGSKELLTEQHSDQQGRRIFVTLLEYGLISMSVIQKLATSTPPNQAARTLLAEFKALKRHESETESPGGVNTLHTAA